MPSTHSPTYPRRMRQGEEGRCTGSADSKLRPPPFSTPRQRDSRVSPRLTLSAPPPTSRWRRPCPATPNRRQRHNVEDGSLGISAVCVRIFGLRSAGSEQTKGGWAADGGAFLGKKRERRNELCCLVKHTRGDTHVDRGRYRWPRR